MPSSIPSLNSENVSRNATEASLLGNAKKRAQLFVSVLFLISAPSLASIDVQPHLLKGGEKATILYRPTANEDISAKTMVLHYGFNGWNFVTVGANAGLDIELGNTNYFLDKKMEYKSELNEYAVEIEIPIEAKALHFVFCWNECKNGQWDNNSAKDYSWPVTFPYIGPLLSFDTITFENPWPSAAWLDYWQEGETKKRLTNDSAQKQVFRLSGLKPGSRYYYQVGLTGEEHKSKIFSFKAPDLSKISTLSFVLFGDPQDDGDSGHFTKIVKAILEDHRDIDFLISTGDLTYNDRPGLWWTFFDKAKDLLASFAFMPAIGNHDTPTVDSNSDSSSYRHYFSLPLAETNDPYYSFKFGNAKFMVMNSELPDELGQEDGRQYQWLKAQIDEEAKWKFVYWHIPPFNIGTRHWQQRRQFRKTTELFDGKVDWYFGGHEHLYQRMQPISMKSGKPEARDTYSPINGGVGYLVIPAAGMTPGVEILSAQESGGEDRDLLAMPQLSADQTTVASRIGYLRVDLQDSEIKISAFGYSPEIKSAPFEIMDSVNYSK